MIHDEEGRGQYIHCNGGSSLNFLKGIAFFVSDFETVLLVRLPCYSFKKIYSQDCTEIATKDRLRYFKIFFSF